MNSSAKCDRIAYQLIISCCTGSVNMTAHPLTVNSAHHTNEEIELLYNDEPEPMTTVIGIRCSDGIVIGTDTQATARTGRTKDLRAEKILGINKFSAMAGSGESDHVKRLWSVIRRKIGNKFYTDDKMIEELESILDELYNKYNVQKSEKMGFSESQILFHPTSILGAKLKDDLFGLYILKDDGFVSRVDNYMAISSGTDLARLLLDMQSRAPASDNKILADLPVYVNIFNACVTINEVKNFDSKSGGSTRIGVITKDGFNMLPSDTISEIYESYIDGISTMFTTGIKDPKAKKTIKEFFRK
jgi:20S proteasome alpha/beta subunit